MFGLSYVDYLVARHWRFQAQGHSATRNQLATQRFLGMPWGWSGALMVGGVVFVATWVSGLLGFWMFVLINLVGVVVLGVVLFSDWQQLQRRQVNASPAPLAWLYGVRGEYTGQYFQLSAHGLSLGRGTSNTILLQDRSVSRQHAQLRYAQGRFYLQDLGSQSGTYLNGLPTDASALKDGDQIAICDTVFEFRTSKG
jgi:hypothetical protein